MERIVLAKQVELNIEGARNISVDIVRNEKGNIEFVGINEKLQSAKSFLYSNGELELTEMGKPDYSQYLY